MGISVLHINETVGLWKIPTRTAVSFVYMQFYNTMEMIEYLHINGLNPDHLQSIDT